MKLYMTQHLAISVFSSLALLAVVTAQHALAPGEAPIAGEATLGATVTETAEIATGWRASKLMHAAVYNESSEKIGLIDDFIVSPDGSLSVAIVDVGRFLGIGPHRVAIPVQQFDQITPKIILKGARKDSLLKMPQFNNAA